MRIVEHNIFLEKVGLALFQHFFLNNQTATPESVYDLMLDCFCKHQPH